jgi:hypothetical protein
MLIWYHPWALFVIYNFNFWWSFKSHNLKIKNIECNNLW